MSLLLRASSEQKHARDLLTWSAWGARLTQQEFLERELKLRTHRWAASGMETWLWVDAQGTPLSSCETFVCSSFRGGVPARTYEIASVFTEEALRGRGHATRMMDALIAEIRAGDPSAHAVTLYSDVGAAIYARSGFVPLPAWDWVFDPCDGAPNHSADSLLMEDALRIPPPPLDEPFAIWPDASQLDWHLARSRFYASVLPVNASPICGAQVGPTSMWWTADFKENLLRILLITAPEPRPLEMLLLAARQLARLLHFSAVVLWEDDALAPLFPAFSGGRRVPRDGSLPMILPLQNDLAPTQWRLRPRALWV